MSRARDLSKLINPSGFSVDTSYNVGLNSTTPDAKLDVIGIVSATAFYGDGSNLEGVASAGLGTALGEDSALSVIYYTDNVLTVGSTITVNPPDSTNVAYTQYAEIVVSDDADLIVAPGDDFIPDVLGLSTETISPISGTGGRVRADNFTSHSGNGAPTFPNGVNVTGVVTATSGSFSGNVSVGGTLTYEDVTNVDSVGMITARKGIQVLADGINAVGVVTATSFSGDGSALSGIQVGVADFVASGTIPNGATVIVNTDGTVGVVTQTGSADPSAGTEVVFESASTYYCSATYDSTNGKVVIAYMDGANNNYGTAIVGTVSGTSISFGSPVVFENSTSVNYIASVHVGSGKIVIVYKDTGDTDKGKGVVGTVSGTSISFGTPVVFETGDTNDCAIAYDSTNQKVAIAYRDNGNSNYGTAVVGTVSGTSISFGSPVVFNSGATYRISAAYDSANGKVVIAYRDFGNSGYGTAIVGTVSGTSISFGSEVVFESGAIAATSIAYDSGNGKVVIAYQDDSNSGYGTGIVGTVSGTSISFGSAAVFESDNTTDIAATYDSTNGKVIIAYQDPNNSGYGTAVVATVSGTDITYSSLVVFNSGSTDYIGAAYDSTNEKTVLAYRDVGNSNYGTSVILSTTTLTTNLTAENYIGIAAEAISDGQTGKVNIVSGINTSQTGLTTAQKYYVQNDGTLGLVPSTPSVVAGTSISSTKIIVKG